MLAQSGSTGLAAFFIKYKEVIAGVAYSWAWSRDSSTWPGEQHLPKKSSAPSVGSGNGWN